MPPQEAEESAKIPKSENSKTTKQTPIGEYATIQDFTKAGLAEIVKATKIINSFPQGSARDLYCAYPVFGKIIDQQNERILGLISKVLKWQNVKGNIQRRQRDEQFEMLLECNDSIMEDVGIKLDEMAGVNKTPTAILLESRFANKPAQVGNATTTIGQGAGCWNVRQNTTSNVAGRLITAKNIARPQLAFPVPVDNSSKTPFIPKLKDKPNSIKPLAILPLYDEAGEIESYIHPYEFELLKFEVKEEQTTRKTPIMPSGLESTPFAIVETKSQLQTALTEMREHKILAVDVEHHSYRSFLGFTCLLQVSTPKKDYLFDTLSLREELHLLNELFTDPKVLKIFHGAQMDIEWLQRDLSIYVVNMFDTHEAAKALNFPRLSLAYLLKHYCQIDADKTLQLADWRIRPLPEELIAYARQDTHYLMYIYECMNNALLDAGNEQNNLVRAIYQRSTELCLRRYKKPVMNDDSHLEFYYKSKKVFNNRQMHALKEIYGWRNKIAREEDESIGYVLPNHMLLQIAETLPREMQGILACCKPTPPLVRQHLPTLHQIILRAREQLLVQPILETTKMTHFNRKEVQNKMSCPFDTSQEEEFRDDLPTLLNIGKKKDNLPVTPNKKESEKEEEDDDDDDKLDMCMGKLDIFEKFTTENDDVHINSLHIQFISPYQRYLAILPIVEKEKQEEAVRMEAQNRQRKLCPDAATVPVIAKEENDESLQNNDMELPVKQFLKRKYEESVANKAKQKNESKATKDEATKAKRMKMQQEIVVSDDDDAPEEVPTASASNEVVVVEPPKQTLSKRQQKLQKARLLQSKKHQKQNKSFQSSDKPVAANFDYKKADFNRFQGGAQRAKGTEIKPQFHGKGKGNKATNKKFNKLFTFSDVKNKKK